MNFNNGPTWNGNNSTGFQQQFPSTQQRSDILTVDIVNGEAMANSYYVAPGVTAVLLDFTNNVFYLKSVDNKFIPQKLRMFDFNERIPQPVITEPAPVNDTQAQIDEIKAMLSTMLAQQNNRSDTNNGRNNQRKQNKGGN